MKISGGVTWCCVALLLALTSVSAVHRGLLHWFANTVTIDENNVISLTFDPNSSAYGSHHYGNCEGLLDPLPWGSHYRYYTIGNLAQETFNPLPRYVARPRRDFAGENRDRIIVRVREENTGRQTFWRIDHVYITQHFHYQREYDPAHTYRITTNLLREIREFSVGPNQQPLSYLRNRFGSSADDVDIENAWDQLACLGLLLYIVLEERSYTPQSNHTTFGKHSGLYNRNDWCAAFANCCRIFVVLLICLYIMSI